MNELEVKELVEGYPELHAKHKELEAKLDRSGGRNPMLEESYLNKLDEIERQIEMIDKESCESSVLTDKEMCILMLKADGYSFEHIGQVFGLGGQSIRNALKKIYKKIAKEVA